MKTILLIEDNLEVRENTAEILDLAKYKVLSAENGKKGVELAYKHVPDLIICDIMMPELDGYGVLHMLVRNPETAGIPFIFLTAKAEKSDFRKGMELGADDYLTKPFDDLELLNAVEIRLKKKTSGNGTGKGQTNIRDILNDPSRSTHFKKKEHIFSEGNYPQHVFFIMDGKVKTFRSSDEGRELMTGIYQDGDYLGYMDVLEETKYQESAQALEDCTLVSIRKEEFVNLLLASPDATGQFIRSLSRNLAEKEERLVKLAYQSVRKRVAESLLFIFDKQQTSPNPGLINMTREDLASLVGSSTETVIRTLSDFKDEKLIESEGRTIHLLNVEKLRKLRN
jgi:CRP/FNR family transcriptional regulator, polysaccharide utilization system transcription regulator